MPQFICLLLLLLPCVAHASPSLLRLCHDDVDLAPWVLRDGKDLSQQLITQSGLAFRSLEIEMLPLAWPRCLKLLESGQVDGAFATSYLAERESYAVYPRKSDGSLDFGMRLNSVIYALYVRQESSLQWNGKRLNPSGATVGIQHGLPWASYFGSWGQHPKRWREIRVKSCGILPPGM